MLLFLQAYDDEEGEAQEDEEAEEADEVALHEHWLDAYSFTTHVLRACLRGLLPCVYACERVCVRVCLKEDDDSMFFRSPSPRKVTAHQRPHKFI